MLSCKLRLLILLPFYISAQKYIHPSKIAVFNVTVNQETGTIKTQVLNDKRPKKAKLNKAYLWYYLHEIKETKGGFAGKLLHGQYSCYSLDNQLIEQGCVLKGSKTGEWRYWYENGQIKEIIEWRHGNKHGKYLLYNEVGRLLAKGKFKNNFLHGKFITYQHSGAKLDKQKYRHGREITRRKVKKKEGKGENETEHNQRKLLHKIKKEERKKERKNKDKQVKKKMWRIPAIKKRTNISEEAIKVNPDKKKKERKREKKGKLLKKQPETEKKE